MFVLTYNMLYPPGAVLVAARLVPSDSVSAQSPYQDYPYPDLLTRNLRETPHGHENSTQRPFQTRHQDLLTPNLREIPIGHENSSPRAASGRGIIK